jgi:hypothetical protein
MKSAAPGPGQMAHLPISLRAYVGSRPPNRERLRPKPSDWTVTFDTETTTDPGQALRIGTYQVRDGGVLKESGMFYNPETLTRCELEIVQAFAQDHCIRCLTRDQFVDDVFYPIGYELRGTVVGFNQPFDIARVAIAHASARGEMRGGFTFKQSGDKRKPPVQIRHLSQKASLIRFAAPFRQRHARSTRKRGDGVIRRGFFVDVHTLAAALFARRFTLKSVGNFLKVKHRKMSAEDHGGPITTKYLGYAIRDVQTTWECYEELVRRYNALRLHDTHPPQIYSEASIGKAYLRAMGVRPWREVQRDVPAALLARILGSYYGGRSEVRIRRELRQVILCDFLSMYPTVCTLVGLWGFVIAEGMEWRESTEEVRVFLDEVTINDLQNSQIWRKLLVLVRIGPDWDVLPVRTSYEGGSQATIGANYLKADQPMWFTLADCIASKLLTGKAPKITEALVFVACKQQVDLRSVAIAGRRRYSVDPTRDDFYKRLIERRDEVKRKRDKARGSVRQTLDADQNALKIAANATSYGIFVEVNVSDSDKPQRVTVYSSIDKPYETWTVKQETPGRFFHPLLATLITGAARLMLAIAERLILDRNLEWAFCDTDSMAIARPADMSEADFHARVDEVVAWFSTLNPYRFGGSILKVERVNFDLKNKRRRRPLWCWAVSAKRYVLFNLDAKGKPVLRKASAHGLGHLRAPYDDSNRAREIPRPAGSLDKIGVALWHHDLWWSIVAAALSDSPDRVDLDYHPALNQPAVSRYAATTPKLLKWFAKFNETRPKERQVKPFGFLYSLQARSFADEPEEILAAETSGPKKRSRRVLKPISPYDQDLENAAAQCIDRETGLPVPVEALKSYKEALESYHLHPETKFLNGDYLDRGITQRRHVHATAVKNIGKEANEWEAQFYLGIDEDEQIDYGIAPRSTKVFLDQLRSAITAVGQRRIARESGISRRTVERLLNGKQTRPSVVAKIWHALAVSGL